MAYLDADGRPRRRRPVESEPARTLDLYGPDARRPGTFAYNCVMARRMAERGVRFIQLFHQGWDQHGTLPRNLRLQCEDIDQACAGLVRDLKLRGMLDETLVVCGGEFGRTIYSQGRLTENDHGRDHHGRCFTTWLAGGGIKGGVEYGKTDDFSYNIVENPVAVRDLNATILHCLGIDSRSRLAVPLPGAQDWCMTGAGGGLASFAIFSCDAATPRRGTSARVPG